ncbi:putative cln3/battenin [Schistosoma mansoni]|uniref:putative cln3/battenin n=1 Tax=Schistosoma mansoni TaxID=6183 RepID=UPI00022DBF3D|nr:putative cln3/battenin [Schistosoma mansoni]|eukprot:XP_018653160.1 putative cln3/battenin [Schistosoma mansoni]
MKIYRRYFGLGNNFSYVIMLSAAVDIIRKHQHFLSLPTNVCHNGDLVEVVNDSEVITHSDGYIQLRNEDDMVYHDSSQIPNNSSLPVLNQQQPTWKIKLQLLKGMIISLFCLVSVYFFEYLINQSLFELLYFQNTRLTAPEQYRW